jgi:tRNA pseudouridine38-40 synthase
MPRYFIEVAYKGTQYSGFQIQQNANTIQAEVEKAFNILHTSNVSFTGSSRTDAGVHAFQNYFHFDYEEVLNPYTIYKMNSILPPDIVAKNIYKMHDEAHSRFDATSREYEYRIYQNKNPFLRGLAYYYPYQLDEMLLKEAASFIQTQSNFFAFSKTNTQVNNYNCSIYKSTWYQKDDMLVYNVKGNRFLRGMVRALTASMLQVARGKLSMKSLEEMFSGEPVKCGLSLPPDGLFLYRISFSFVFTNF